MILRPFKVVLLSALIFFIYIPVLPLIPSLIVPQNATAVSFTLWGAIVNAAGWGFTSSTITNPGPDIVVSPGASVTLSLFSADGNPSVIHQFCVDSESTPNFTCEANEPKSPTFTSATTPTMFTFTATSTPGTYTYFCTIHGMSMQGKFVVQPVASFNLRGRVISPAGWSFTANTETNPGPDIVVAPGTSVTLTLFSDDTAPHQFCVDYNGNGSCDTATEPESGTFSSATTGLTFTFTATPTPGNYTYFCVIHGIAAMNGKFVVQPVHDLAVTGIVASRNFAYQGVASNPVQVNVTTANRGLQTETFWVAVEANSTVITNGNTTVTIANGKSLVVSFSFSTSSLLRGKYILTGLVKVLQGDPTPADNTMSSSSTFVVRLKGDLNGDCFVDISDLAIVGSSFGKTISQPGYNANADILNAGTIDISDLAIVGSVFGTHC